jgi:hypothetical protein
VDTHLAIEWNHEKSLKGFIEEVKGESKQVEDVVCVIAEEDGD